jgi:hypothetical protein
MRRSQSYAATAALVVSALWALVPAGAGAQTVTVPGLYLPEWQEARDRSKDELPPQFRLINYFFSRATFSNDIGDPSGLKGVSLGPLGEPQVGSAVRNGVGNGYWAEQRWIPVIEYSPYFADRLASFRAQFRINYVWGMAANTTQTNQGGGFNANEINIQTKNANVAIYPTRDPDELAIVLGTQPAYDNVVDPSRTGLNDIVRSGYKLAFLGSDATGLSIYGSRWGGRAKLSILPLGWAQPDNATKGDPRISFIWLTTADAQYELQPGTWMGLSFWYLRDDTKGAAYAYEGLVNSGPSSGGLSAYTGTAPFLIDRPTGNVFWLGYNAHHNLDFKAGRFAASGFAMYNFGQFDSNKADTLLNKSVDISGLSADLELLYNWGHSVNDVLSLETVYSSGDSNPNDGHYSGAFTMNYYGLPGATWFNHRCLLLFPFTSTVVNYTGAVTDLSNQGAGLETIIGAATYDLVPNKLNLKVGAAYGRSAVNPANYPGSTTRRGRSIGTEFNAEVKYTIRYLMTVGLHAGVLLTGSWFDGETSRITENPFALFTTFTWYAF